MRYLGKIAGAGFAGAVLLAVAGMGSTAQAALTCDGTAGSDVSLTVAPNTYHASSCSALSFPNNSNNTITNQFNAALGPGYDFILKHDGGSSASGSAFGLNFTLSADLGDKVGSWTLSWTDLGPADLPMLLDFGVVLKGGPDGAGYVLSDVLLTTDPNTGQGSFTIQFLNPGGQTPGLSYFALLGSNPRPYENGTPVPEPVSLALLGMGLLGLGAVRARRRRAA